MNLPNEIRLALTGHPNKVAEVLAKNPALAESMKAGFENLLRQDYENRLDNNKTPSPRF
jgi:hypothetical protein